MAVRKIHLSHDEASGRLIEEFFGLVAQKLGFDPEDPKVRYDCRKLEISTHIQALIYQAYAERYPYQFAQMPQACREAVTIAFAQYGPKENPALPDYAIELDDAFLVFLDGRTTANLNTAG